MKRVVASINWQMEVLAASPHHPQKVELDGHLPERRGKIIALILKLRKLRSKYDARVLHANIYWQCSGFGFRFVHVLLSGHARLNFELVEEPIIYWHKRHE